MLKIISIFVLIIASSLANAQSCQFKGAFTQIVFDTLGKDLAMAQSSYGVALMHRQTGEIFCSEFVQPKQNIYPASSIKTLIAVAVLRRIDRGEIHLTDQVIMNQPNGQDECPDWNCAIYGNGNAVTIQKLLFDMITISNNLATNQLIDVVGKPMINETADLLQAPSLRVFRKVYNHVDPEPQILTPNTATAISLTQMYREIASGRLHLLSETARGYVIDLLRQQTINGSLNGDFPSQVHFYHKTGNTSKVTSDGGFYPLGQDLVVILVGLQNFRSYQRCVGACTEITGFQSLRRIGKLTLDLTFKMAQNLPLVY